MPWYLPICKSTVIAKELQCLKFQSLKIQFCQNPMSNGKNSKAQNPEIQCQNSNVKW